MPLMHSPPPQEHSSPSSSSKLVQPPPRIRIKNRRKLYLDRNPSYFTSPDLELLDPLLYDRCIRRFQTPAEREADSRSKGYSGVLEADLYRSEAKLAAIQSSTSQASQQSQASSSSDASITYAYYSVGVNGSVFPETDDEVPKDKEEGFEKWKFEMTMRFLKGEDPDFDYKLVDESGDFDNVERKEEEERWFEDEEPAWVEEGDGVKGTGGETGIQDF